MSDTHPSHDLGKGSVQVRSVGNVRAEYWVRACRGCGAESMTRLGLGNVGRDARKIGKPCPALPSPADDVKGTR